MEKHFMLVRDNDDYNYIYGAIVFNKNGLNVELLQKRLNNMYEVLNKNQICDYNGDYIVKRVLESHEEYKDLEYIRYINYDVEV